MNTAFIIKQAILSEKAYAQMNSGVYAFKVDKRATKKEIANALKRQFSVEVEKVNIISLSPHKRRITGTRKEVEIAGGKKAIVYLKPGQSIALLSPKRENKAKAQKGAKVSKVPSQSNEEPKKKGILSRIGTSKKEKQEKESK